MRLRGCRCSGEGRKAQHRGRRDHGEGQERSTVQERREKHKSFAERLGDGAISKTSVRSVISVVKTFLNHEGAKTRRSGEEERLWR